MSPCARRAGERARPAAHAVAERVLAAERALLERLRDATFASPITHVYNPLDYAWPAHAAYTRAYCGERKLALLVGMNPGPFGMVQTGVPFGDVSMCREVLQLAPIDIGRPRKVHPKRPVEGYACARTEVSGTRLWSWARDAFEDFFSWAFVYNYCPLTFMEASGRNRTPAQLGRAERERVERACDEALVEVARAVGAKYLIGVGEYARRCIERALANEKEKAEEREKRENDGDGDGGFVVGRMLHPSPASPAANQGWAAVASRQLRALWADDREADARVRWRPPLSPPLSPRDG